MTTSRTVEVLDLAREAAVSIAAYGMGHTLRSEVFPGFELPVADVFVPLIG